ncbi:hypothetical protein PTSG_12902 [Salpingoeca rosetta]|uniref:Uncharacterized protein n=1 Tax=Salpingoeca rosetta (strain ATCC 50818 / BSB-021) TaxID=946362 RepID=F2ULF6_SALR5|nr:uncharacterized protein PTSG_12902 [Salpingoeca rosetta]EGD77955.1 hypothetical protein PTSG_12902 [Salpingoeca rosetta]|eukprot:XP_004990018.1 hypothetical protein PTSG_12902 [Salpingoeca rosetta]
MMRRRSSKRSPADAAAAAAAKENRQLKRKLSKLQKQLEDRSNKSPAVDPAIQSLVDASAQEIDRILTELVDRRMRRTAHQRGTAGFLGAAPQPLLAHSALPASVPSAAAASKQPAASTAQAAPTTQPSIQPSDVSTTPPPPPPPPPARVAASQPSATTATRPEAQAQPQAEQQTQPSTAQAAPQSQAQRRRSSDHEVFGFGATTHEPELDINKAPVLRRWSHFTTTQQQQQPQQQQQSQQQQQQQQPATGTKESTPVTAPDVAALEDIEGFGEDNDADVAQAAAANDVATADEHTERSDEGKSASAEVYKPKRKLFSLRSFARSSRRRSSRKKAQEQQQEPQQQQEQTVGGEEAAKAPHEEAAVAAAATSQPLAQGPAQDASSEDSKPVAAETQPVEVQGQQQQHAEQTQQGRQEPHQPQQRAAKPEVPPEVMQRIFGRTASSRRDVSQRELNIGAAPVASKATTSSSSSTAVSRLEALKAEKERRKQQRLQEVKTNLQVAQQDEEPNVPHPAHGHDTAIPELGVSDDNPLAVFDDTQHHFTNTSAAHDTAGSSNANDDAILAAMARTNPKAYEEYKTRTQGMQPPGDTVTSMGTKHGALTALPQHLYILAMVEAGLSEDDERQDRLRRRFFVHPSTGERVFREEDVAAAEGTDDDDDDEAERARTASMLLRDSEADRRAAMLADLARRKAAAKERKRQAKLRRQKAA